MDAQLLQRGFTPEPLKPALYRELDQNGFAVLENVIGPKWLEQLRQTFEELVEEEGEEAGVEVAQMKRRWHCCCWIYNIIVRRR